MTEIGTLTLNPNPLVYASGKQPHEFIHADITRFIAEQGIPVLNLRYLGGDGRLKMLNPAIQSVDHLSRILTMREWAGGSLLFDFADAAGSDLYVVPQLHAAFLNPFSELSALDIMYDSCGVEGSPPTNSLQQIFRKVQQALKDETGCRLEALGELEYYLFSPTEKLSPVEPQRGYHGAGPFSKWEAVRVESLVHLARMGCSVKYAHSEIRNFIADGLQIVQQEVELPPIGVTCAADKMTLAKQVVRQVAHPRGIEVSFSPKIAVRQAGSGMHSHTRLMKDGVNQFSEDAGLTDVACRVVGDYLSHVASLAAFGNLIPTSFLRLVPHQEAPTVICQEDHNRSVLMWVPLDWQNLDDHIFHDTNPQEGPVGEFPNDSQTVGFRSPDGAANIHLLLADLIVAARIGLSDPVILDYATIRYVSDDASKYEGLDQLSSSCAVAVRCLLDQWVDYKAQGVFPPGLIDAWATRLLVLEDESPRKELTVDRVLVEDLMARHLHIR